MSQQLWYLTKNGQQSGPYHSQDLVGLAQQGGLSPHDMLWTDGWTEWKPVAATSLAQYIPPPPVVPQARPVVPQAMPLAAPPPVSAGLGLVVTPTAAPSATRLKSRRKENPAGKVALIVAGLLLFASAFLPWWEYTVKDDGKKLDLTNLGAVRTFTANMTKEVGLMQKYEDWYKHDVGEVGYDEKTKIFFMSSSGMHTTSGTMSLILGLLVIGLAAVPLFVAHVRSWAWIASFVAAAIGLPIAILTLTWMLRAPWEDIKPAMTQGLVAGVYVNIAAAAALIIAGVVDGIVGLKASARRV